MKAYPSYKDSGIDWIREIPDHWIVPKIKRYFSVSSGDFHPNKYDNDHGYPIYGGNGLRGYSSHYNCEGKSLLIGRVGAKCGNIHLVDKKYWVSEHALRVLPKKDFNFEYFGYLLEIINLNQFAIQTAQPLINSTIVTDRYAALPPRHEQEQIADYIDQKTQLIDKLIEKKQKLIELLKEKRTAIIDQAVTKGIDPGVEMKDSGVEWIGEIPKNWDIKKIKYLKSSKKYSLVDGPFGSNLKTEHYVDNGDVYIIESGFITSGEFQYVRDFKTITDEHFETIKRSECNEGDIIISKIGEYYGMCSILPKLDKRTVISGNSITLTISKNHNTNFIHQVILQHHINGTFKKEVQQTGQPFISLGVINNLIIPTPTLLEQNQIVEHLDEQIQKINSTIEKELNRIELLKEYCQSLISEVVTGKIDVRIETTQE